MNKTKRNFNSYFEKKDLSGNELYSSTIIESLTRSILEPIAKENSKAIVFTRLKNVKGTDGLIKRLEYSKDIILREFSDFEFSKFDIEETGFVVLTTQRYNCAFLFREKEENKYPIIDSENGTVVYTSKILNGIKDVIDTDLEYILLNSFMIDESKFKEVLEMFKTVNNENKNEYYEKINNMFNADTLFLHKETIYKVK